MIKKNLFDRFITKYNLNGSTERVTWVATKGTLTTKFMTDDKNAIGEVTLNEHVLDDGSYYVIETSQLKNLMGVLGEEISLKVQSTNGRTTGLLLSDGESKATFILASDDSSIPKTPKPKVDFNQFPFQISIPIDKNFMERFNRAKGGLPDVTTFTVLCDGKTVDIVLGYSTINTNRIALKVQGSTMSKIDPIDFHARSLRDIFTSNKEATAGTLDISTDGLLRVKLTQDDFTVSYYLPQVKVEN
jgi:hypothetical protein